MLDIQTQPQFPLIADPENYRAHTINMIEFPKVFDYWVSLFAEHSDVMRERCVESHAGRDDAVERAQWFQDKFREELKQLREQPTMFGEELTILKLCRRRLELHTEAGFEDPFKPMKDIENAAALKLLPGVLRDLDEQAMEDRLLILMRGIFAGNIFDMGAKDTIELYESGGIDFHKVRESVQRPFFVDDFDILKARFESYQHRKAVMFVDNAGSDVVLGMLPFARYLLQRGTQVVLTANTVPSLNDITHEELIALLEQIRVFDDVFDEALKSGQVVCEASGNDLPVIDLRITPAGLNALAADADLLVLEGMGRGLETNYDTRFTCDTLKLAMIKDQQVMDHFGSKLYDVVCRFEPGGE